MFTATFDEASLKAITAFAGFPILLSQEVQQAEGQVAGLIITKTHDNALERFMNNSPGGLAESFFATKTSPFEIEVGSDAPHAHRRDQGFDGADSLGRVYHDKAYLYFSDAVQEVEMSGEGMEALQAGVEKAMQRMGV